MTDILTPKELDAIRGRCEAATEGPWRHDMLPPSLSFETIRTADDPPTEIVACDAYHRNATFIAHARSDIPRLLAHVAALEAELVRWLPVDKDTQTYSVTAERTQP